MPGAGRILAVALLWSWALPAGAQPETAEAITHRVCTGCHSLQVVMDTPKDFDTWHDTVQKMIDHGAQGTPDDFAQIMQYLFETMTTVDINHGDQDELMTVLHTNAETADAIIARRATHPFKDLAELEAAFPTLNRALLDSKKRMIFFR